MSLEIKCHTVPHLKALKRSIEQMSGHGRGSTFKQCYNVLKNTISLHKWPKQRFHVMVAVVSAQEGGSILKIEFAISKKPYFYSVYLLQVGYFCPQFAQHFQRKTYQEHNSPLAQYLL